MCQRKSASIKYFASSLLMMIIIDVLNAQETSIETAQNFMIQVAEKYATFEDLQANITVTQNNKVSKGVLFSKNPNKLRINFSTPKDQVMVSDGEMFYIYIPQQNIVLEQLKDDATSTSSFTNRTGLEQLLKRYIPSYVDKPKFIALENRNPKKYVMKIQMKWKSPSESFRKLTLSIGKDLFIYRVEAITYNRKIVQFDFSNIQVNKGIPNARFTYDPPPTASVIENFLF